MFDKLPTNYAVDLRTPDPVIVKIQPSKELLFVILAFAAVGAAWVKSR
ncbi:hypothetical protein [Shewanella gelidii]|nr:hypothetical protein [Shewanella gelidii]MCL1098053.1 hypothetical protein [Shewanella gelidii]MCL1098076.1 hypothetical protein [Shewanella gelidii]